MQETTERLYEVVVALNGAVEVKDLGSYGDALDDWFDPASFGAGDGDSYFTATVYAEAPEVKFYAAAPIIGNRSSLVEFNDDHGGRDFLRALRAASERVEVATLYALPSRMVLGIFAYTEDRGWVRAS